MIVTSLHYCFDAAVADHSQPSSREPPQRFDFRSALAVRQEGHLASLQSRQHEVPVKRTCAGYSSHWM